MTGMLLAPPLQHTALARVELASLGDDRALAVVVTETGWVTVREITLRAAAPASTTCARSGASSPGASAARPSRQILDDGAGPADPLDTLCTRGRGRSPSRSSRCCAAARST